MHSYNIWFRREMAKVVKIGHHQHDPQCSPLRSQTSGLEFLSTLFNGSHLRWTRLNHLLTLSYKCGSPKNAQRKSCQFFVTFPKYVNGVLETTFCSQITFGLTGRWQKWSKLAYFRKGGPCREQYDAKIINTYKCQLQHVARNFLVLFML